MTATFGSAAEDAEDLAAYIACAFGGEGGGLETVRAEIQRDADNGRMTAEVSRDISEDVVLCRVEGDDGADLATVRFRGQ